MQVRNLIIATGALLVAVSTNAQSTVTTNGGTAGTVPLFSGASSVGNSFLSQGSFPVNNSSITTPTVAVSSRLFLTTPGSILSLRGLVNTSWTYDLRDDQVSALTIQSEAPSSVPFAIDSAGDIGVGIVSPGSDLTGLQSAPPSGTTILEVNGDIALTQGKGGQMYFSDGSVQTTAWNGVLTGGDYAESVNITGHRKE